MSQISWHMWNIFEMSDFICDNIMDLTHAGLAFNKPKD